MLRTFASIALLAVTAVAGAAPARFGHFALDVPARGFEEHCLKLEAGERIRYRFRAAGEVDFNIHYHRGTDVHYPVRSSAIQAADATFSAPQTDDYCLMWERKGAGAVRIEGSVDRVTP
jgi:hypothetical protein